MQLKIIFRRLDFWLRDEPYRDADTPVIMHSIDELFEDRDDPLRTRVYWAVIRFWNHHWLCNPGRLIREVKWFIQRGRRGWADRDTWSLDWYLDGWLPDALRLLKENKHGIPISMLEGLPVNDKGYHDKPEMAIGQVRWDEILDKIIAGFEASRRIHEGLYEEELGEYPIRRPKSMSRETWAKLNDDRFKASRLLRDRDQKLFEEGMKLFVEHYWDLWD